MFIPLRTREYTLRSLDADWNAADWEQLPHDNGHRFEIIDGVLYMSSVPSPYHQWIGGRALWFCHEQIEQCGLGFALTAPLGLFLPGRPPVQPDLLVLAPGDRELLRARRLEAIPLLIVEILSPANPEHDLVTKLALYAGAGVPEYWVFRPATRDVLVHSDPGPVGATYRRVEALPHDGEWVAHTLPCRAPVASFFAGPV